MYWGFLAYFYSVGPEENWHVLGVLLVGRAVGPEENWHVLGVLLVGCEEWVCGYFKQGKGMKNKSVSRSRSTLEQRCTRGGREMVRDHV